MGCDFNADGDSKFGGKIFMQGQTTIGMVEPINSEIPNCSGAFFVDSGVLKLKYKDGDGVVTVFIIDTNPPGFQPTP